MVRSSYLKFSLWPGQGGQGIYIRSQKGQRTLHSWPSLLLLLLDTRTLEAYIRSEIAKGSLRGLDLKQSSKEALVLIGKTL
jgi:hypothetical protein